MGIWRVVTPEGTTNYVLNPSAESDTDWSIASAGVVRTTTYNKYGLYSWYLPTTSDNDGVNINVETLSNAIHYVTVRVRGDFPPAWKIGMRIPPATTAYYTPTLIEQVDDDWYLYGVQFSAAECNGATFIRVLQDGAGSGDWYVDGVQVEQKEYWTTYCDGTQEGCTWNGTKNTSTSTRSALSRAGGKVVDLDDYSFYTEKVLDTGDTSVDIHIDKYSTLPGGELNNININPRVFTLSGVLIGESETDLNTKRKTLIELLSPSAYPKDNNGYQPVRLRYYGTTIKKEIAAHLETGLQGDIEAQCDWERLALRFIAADPFFYGIGTVGYSLDTEDTATFRIIAGRLKSSNQWSALGPPNAAGTHTSVRALVQDDDYLYVAGDFTDFDGVSNQDYIVTYNKETGVWDDLGSGTDGPIYAMVIMPNGDLVAGGDFTIAGGVSVDNIAMRPTNPPGIWTKLGTTGANGIVYALVVDNEGTLYAAGDFTDIDGVTVGRIAYWDGTNWNALAAGTTNNTISALAVDKANNLYIGGSFTTIYGVSINRIAKYAGGGFTSLGTGSSGSINVLIVDENNNLYAGTGGVTIGGVDARIAKWNGTQWTSVDNNTIVGSVFSLAFGSDGTLYAGGSITSFSGVDVNNGMVFYNGSSFGEMDINLPGAPSVFAILTGEISEPLVDKNYDIWLGFSTEGTGLYAGKTTLENTGNEPVYPKLVFSRSGGTSAAIKSLYNETNGLRIYFNNYFLQDGESLTINLDPKLKTIISDYYGSKPGAVFAYSDLGQFRLIKGNNDITSFVDNNGATVTAWLEFRPTFRSFD